MVKYLLYIPLIIAIIGCEKTQVVENDISFQEFIVVNAQLNSGNAFGGVTFTKTIPLGITYNIKDAELKDVTAYIKINGVQIVPLHYVSDGVYKPLNDLSIGEGYTYELFAEWRGTFIYSKTQAPYFPEIKSAQYIAGGQYLQAELKAHPGEVYGAIWLIVNSSAENKIFPSLSIPGSTESTVSVITSSIPFVYTGSNYNGLRYIQVFAYDKQYADYFNSAKFNAPNNNAFLSSGGSVGWNVYGNNVIGMFIGVAIGASRNVN